MHISSVCSAVVLAEGPHASLTLHLRGWRVCVLIQQPGVEKAEVQQQNALTFAAAAVFLRSHKRDTCAVVSSNHRLSCTYLHKLKSSHVNAPAYASVVSLVKRKQLT